MQVCAALAPSWTANAWGGPTYVGASMAHWLDGYLLFYASALLLHVVLVQPRASNGTARDVLVSRSVLSAARITLTTKTRTKLASHTGVDSVIFTGLPTG